MLHLTCEHSPGSRKARQHFDLLGEFMCHSTPANERCLLELRGLWLSLYSSLATKLDALQFAADKVTQVLILRVLTFVRRQILSQNQQLPVSRYSELQALQALFATINGRLKIWPELKQ